MPLGIIHKRAEAKELQKGDTLSHKVTGAGEVAGGSQREEDQTALGEHQQSNI